jgi:GT2 family glycosyltransferase
MISIIIPNYNGERFLPACLDSIFSQDFSDFEVILVDNASSDHSVALVQLRYPTVTIIKNRMNRGYAGGGNDGIRSAFGDYFLILNTDTVLCRNFLSIIHSSAKQKPEYGMYAPKILYPDGMLHAAGCSASFSGSSWERGKGEADMGMYNIPCEVFSPYGAAALFSRELIDKTGGFDEDFFLYVEETDLAFRARLAGYRCWYEPGAAVTHHHGGTVGRTSDMALYYLHRNTLWYVLKCYPGLLFIFAVPFIIGRNGLAVLYYLYKGRGDIVIRAKIDAIRGLPLILRKRKGVYRTAGKTKYQLRLFHLS